MTQVMTTLDSPFTKHSNKYVQWYNGECNSMYKCITDNEHLKSRAQNIISCIQNLYST